MKPSMKLLIAAGVSLLVIAIVRSAKGMGNAIGRFFRIEEFKCKDGTPVPEELTPNLGELVQQLDIIRSELGPLVVVSGYRTKTYNDSINGADKSKHLTAEAADISSPNMSAPQLADAIEALIAAGKVRDGGLGRYEGWVHYDVGTPRRWSA